MPDQQPRNTPRKPAPGPDEPGRKTLYYNGGRHQAPQTEKEQPQRPDSAEGQRERQKPEWEHHSEFGRERDDEDLEDTPDKASRDAEGDIRNQNK